MCLCGDKCSVIWNKGVFSVQSLTETEVSPSQRLHSSIKAVCVEDEPNRVQPLQTHSDSGGKEEECC